MILKRFRLYSKNALLIVLSMMVIAGATGLSYKAHYCHGHLSGIAFYTELGIQKSATCGCNDDARAAKLSVSGRETLVKKSGCCSDISFFNKLTIESFANDFSPAAPVQPAVIAIFCVISCPPAAVNNDIAFFDTSYPPPHLSGRKLVLFLSQQRIPLITYYC